MTKQAELNDLIREAYDAQEGFDNWDEGKTYYPHSPFIDGPRKCSLDEVVAELDAANLKLVQFVVWNAVELTAELMPEPRVSLKVGDLSEEELEALRTAQPGDIHRGRS